MTRTEPRTGYRHSQQCWDIGGGPGHETCICRCHETMSARDIILDDPDWHAAACAYDGDAVPCDCVLPDRLAAVEAEARLASSEQETGLDELRALSEKATPGPWFWNSYSAIYGGVPVEIAGDDPEYPTVIPFDRPTRGDIITLHSGDNARLIVAAVNYVRDCLARAYTDDTDSRTCAADESSCPDPDCPRHGFDTDSREQTE